MPSKELSGQICIVTGASRGIGEGVALQLGEAGATVYVTGRQPSAPAISPLEKVAQEITKRGGKGIAVYVDHGNMDEVKAFFERIDEENDGQLDVLVNNAFAGVQLLLDNVSIMASHQMDPAVWDQLNNVGLRNHYYCSVYAAKMMVKNKRGLIVNISSFAGLKYLFNAADGAGKSALDRIAIDMAHELRDHNIACVSIWPGPVKTQLVGEAVRRGNRLVTAERYQNGESLEYTGIGVRHLAGDSRKMDKSGWCWHTSDLGLEYGFTDVDGVKPPNFRSLKWILAQTGWNTTSLLVPECIRLPGWMMSAMATKF